jgi:uncharacterized protein (TIGR03000 family)
MYSVVLMVAMTGGTDVPAGFFGHGSCHGSYYSSCYGSDYGSCHGWARHGYSCHGWSDGYSCHGWSGHGHSCHGYSHYEGWSCHGGYGCEGWGHHSHYSCYGSCYGVSYGCNGGWFHHREHRHWGHDDCCAPVYYGCCGGAPVAPAGAPVEKIEKKPVAEELQTAAPATLIVSVPADAKLLIDDAATTSTSTRRVFVSPTLPAGREFSYSLKAEFTKNGKSVVVTKEVIVRAGAEINVTMEDGLASIASR